LANNNSPKQDGGLKHLAQLFVDVLDAGALVVHAPKSAGLFALRVVVAEHIGYAQDDAGLAQRHVFLLAADIGGICHQPVDVAFERLNRPGF
jgi:hypothetical protein